MVERYITGNIREKSMNNNSVFYKWLNCEGIAIVIIINNGIYERKVSPCILHSVWSSMQMISFEPFKALLRKALYCIYWFI